MKHSIIKNILCAPSSGNLHFCRICVYTAVLLPSLVFHQKLNKHLQPFDTGATRNISPARFKKVCVKPQGRYLLLFFRIVTDIRYNSIADDCICFSIDGGRIRGFRVDELWPFSCGQTGSAERTQREFRSVELSLIKNLSVRRTASGNAQRTVRIKHTRAEIPSFLPSATRANFFLKYGTSNNGSSASIGMLRRGTWNTIKRTKSETWHMSMTQGKKKKKKKSSLIW